MTPSSSFGTCIFIAMSFALVNTLLVAVYKCIRVIGLFQAMPYR